jgi:hypothetical protein
MVQLSNESALGIYRFTWTYDGMPGTRQAQLRGPRWGR